jgi:diguanylate cyclase (GGDEF)-like protein
MRDLMNTRKQLLAEVDALRIRVKDLESQCAHTEKNAVRRSEEKYRLLFHSTPIALIERDASRLKIYLDRLRESGVSDFEEYLRDNLQETAHCMSMIKTVEFNDAFLKLLEVDTRDELEVGFPFIGSPEEFHRLVVEMIPMIAERNISREREVTIVTGKGNKRNVLTKALIVSGSEDTLARIVIAMVDITKRKEAEESLRISEQRFREQAMRDNLTGLYNRRYLYNTLSGMIASGRATQSSLSLIFMDLDNFKKVVDTYGHLNGSRAIQEVAGTIQETIAAPAFAVAYAGDEFVIVLPEFDQFQAAEKASSLQSRIKSAVYLRDLGLEVKLQASYGVATFPDHARDLTGLLASADRALFSVKEKGRGGVAFADRLTSFETLFNPDGIIINPI